MFPVNNRWAAIGGLLMGLLYVVLQAARDFFATGQPWPQDANGWITVLIPGIVIGLIGMMTPHYSTSEARHGYRVARLWRGDVPVESFLTPHDFMTHRVHVRPDVHQKPDPKGHTHS